MYTKQAQVPVSQLVREREDRAEVLEAYGIDLCCGGTVSLGEACAARGVSFEEVRRALEVCDSATDPAAKTDWASESMTNLAEHIVAWHHDYLRDQLPRLGVLLEKVVARHAGRHPNLVELRQLYSNLWIDLLDHMMKEEFGLFPLVRELDRALQTHQPPPRSPCGSVRHPIHVMEDDHRSVGESLRRMSELTFDYQAPDDACNSYRELLDGLAGLESDIHLHIHKENNLLFPRLAEAEALMMAGGVYSSSLQPAGGQRRWLRLWRSQ